jgi:superfamily II DNA or RNA helicase
MALPDYIDNTQHRLDAILQEIILKEQETTLDIATGYFRIEAWQQLEDALNTLTRLRLLIGRDPSIEPANEDQINLRKFFRRNVQNQLEQEPFNLGYKQLIDRLIAFLQQDHIDVRLYGGMEGYKARFLHAKAYIFDNYSIIGSSNLTPSGLRGNTELNLLNKSTAVSKDLRSQWFERFWDDPCVDLDYKTKLIDTLNASKFGSKAYTPYQVFVKALYELFKEDSGIEGSDRTSLELASFQQQGFEQAVKLLEKHQACMVADAVGLGKTYIGLRLIEHYLQRERKPGYVPRALVVCPAQLRDLVWHKKLDEFGIKASIISQEELGRSNFNISPYNKYDIVVIDESHNFRNSNTNRYRNLQRLLGSGRRHKRVVLLTATPINNTVYDLYHQILLMTRNTETYYREWGISNLSGYFQKLNKGEVEITDLLMQTMVRRSRQDVIKRQQAGEQIFISGKEIRFPKRQLENFTYNFEDSYQGLYVGIATQIEQLNLAPYNIRAFKKKLNDQDKTQIKKNEALVALMKTLWLKRLESSLTAFTNSITTQRNYQVEFRECLEQGKLLDSKNFRKLLVAETDEEERTSISEILASLEVVEPKEYNLNQLGEQISDDFHTLEDILRKLETIETAVQVGQDSDRKLAAFKDLLSHDLVGQKILVFSYFKDTAQYLYNKLMNDQAWLNAMTHGDRLPVIELLTGDTSGKQREEKVRRFAPKSNCQDKEDLQFCLENPIDILICTDVLSEGQNLQDAGVLVNYDLHWNPVRMIQRAGRIDRLGTDFAELFIYNCFPEEGLEHLLGLVRRLQQRIATIDREVGLDGSVLGETISEKSLDEIRKLKEADTDVEKAAILEELELTADLASLDEMRFPLLEFFANEGREAAEDIPLGIHSTRTDGTPGLDGIFLAFRARGQHIWHFYKRVDGHISTDPLHLTTGKGQIFRWLRCSRDDYPNPDALPPVQFDNAIFAVLEGAVRNILTDLQKQRSTARLKPTLSKLLQKIYTALTQSNLFDVEIANQEAREQILKIITTINLRVYEPEIRGIWESYTQHQNLNTLVSELDEYFVDKELGQELEQEEAEDSTFEAIKREEVQLVCFEWFKPVSLIH